MDTRLAVGAMELKIESIQESLAVWKKSTEGKLLVSQDGKIKRAKTALHKLQVLNGINGVAGTSDNSPNQDFLEEVATFIEGGDDCIDEVGLDDGEEANIDEVAESTAAPAQTATRVMNDLEMGIESVKKKIKELEESYAILKAIRVQPFENPMKKGNAYLKALKLKITNFKSDHKKDGHGIEAKIFQVLKIKYGVKVQAYHGGTMTGKDN